ncbi:hypothetical protein LCGC14_2665260 [marine sediment metagenome]|uniref:Uncharacterized protein n=1 Tax=marine sediment metagenome TaxID=412755 RepID=A0A0F9AD30_9ZZZZ
MKLHEASAVFLIIAGVLLGTIESQEVGTRIPAGKEFCQEGFDCLPPEYEPTAETCARALRDIGATEDRILISRDGEKNWVHNGQGRIIGSRRDTPVLCIPAPSGLRGK